MFHVSVISRWDMQQSSRTLPRIYFRKFRGTHSTSYFQVRPYYRTEQYGREHGQSWIRYGSYSEWRNRFLAAVIGKGCRLLRPGGYFLLNVKHTPKWPIARDARALFPQGFQSYPTIRYLLPAQPHHRWGSNHLYNWEPILVVRRPLVG
jgi:hypothetical protein